MYKIIFNQKLLALVRSIKTKKMEKVKFLLPLICIFLIANSQFIYAQNNEEGVYDEELAKSLNADDYGMKKYVIAFLKSGPNRSKDEATKAKLQKAHMKNISRMAEEGILVLAGPFFGDGDLRGIYVFNVETIEEAEKLTETDPLIQSGGLVMKLHEWYGSAAVQKIGEIHKTIQKKDF